MSAITSERNVRSSSRKASDSTKAKTHGARALMSALKSCDIAVVPLTYVRTPGLRSSVAGSTSSRRAASARSEVASVPLPATAIVMTATVRSSLMEKPNGGWSRPVARARSRSSLRATVTLNALPCGIWTAITAGSGPPGNARWMRS